MVDDITPDSLPTMNDADSRITHHASRPMRRVPLLALCFHLALAILQVAFFGVLLEEGQSIEAVTIPEPLYRVDGVGVVLGVVWCLAMALVAWPTTTAPRLGKWQGLYACAMTVGMLSAFYARAPLLLYAGWEVAGVGLWLTLRSGFIHPAAKSGTTQQKPRLSGLTWNVGWILHVAGWPLLLMILLGLVAPFAPPSGGVAEAWPLPIALGAAVVVLIRSGCPPIEGWFRQANQGAVGQHWSLFGLYSVAAPMLLDKMLVAAPWDAVGGWALALVGMIALISSVGIPFFRGDGYSYSLPAACSAAAMIGFGLAQGSPLVAAAAIALLVAGMISLAMLSGRDGRDKQLFSRMLVFLGLMPAIWMLSQGALELGYSVVAAIMLPAFAVLVGTRHLGADRPCILTETAQERDIVGEGDSRTDPTQVLSATRYSGGFYVGGALLMLAAIYPQALVEFVLRPAVNAMAGGVGALSTLKSDWGLGLTIASAQGAIVAALPATGIAVAVFLAWVTLYWLQGLLSRFARKQRPGAKAE